MGCFNISQIMTFSFMSLFNVSLGYAACLDWGQFPNKMWQMSPQYQVLSRSNRPSLCLVSNHCEYKCTYCVQQEKLWCFSDISCKHTSFIYF